VSVLHDSTGLFPRSQPAWAEQRIATFPVHVTATGVKKPAVKHYGKIGLPASRALALKPTFAKTDGIGFMAGPWSKITVIDIDDTDERLLSHVLDHHGPTPFVVRTASGKFHAYYKHSGERRRIRPWLDLPIDLLGVGGFVVAPPSLIVGKGAYEIIEGKLDDLRRLPPIRDLELDGPSPIVAEEPTVDRKITIGERNITLWRHCMICARQCESFDALLDIARSHNMTTFHPPLPDVEMITITHNAWDRTQRGLNWVGRRGAFMPIEEIAALAADPHATYLLLFLRAHNWPGSHFMCTNTLSEKFGWDRRRLAAARHKLIELNIIHPVRQAGRGHPALFKWGRR